MITAEELVEAVPHIKNAGDLVVPLNDAMRSYGISDTPIREAMFLAQVAHESGGFYYTREIASGKAYDNREDLGNTKPDAIEIAARHGSTPGVFWKGGGWLQTTGYDNYCQVRDALSLDCVEHPELLEIPVNAARSAALFWYTRGLNQIADKDDFLLVTKKINGGTNGYPSRLAYLDAFKRAMKI